MHGRQGMDRTTTPSSADPMTGSGRLRLTPSGVRAWAGITWYPATQQRTDTGDGEARGRGRAHE